MPFKCLILFLLLCISLGGHFQAFAVDTDPASLLEAADTVLDKVVQVRGLDLKSPVRKSVQDELEIAAYIRSEIREDYDRDDLNQEGCMLHILGLIPDPATYRDNIYKLLSESVESRYDPRKNIFYIASWLPADEQGSVLAHEYMHILQDQHFNIENITESDRAVKNDDRALAHQALLEGDRTVVMLQIGLEKDKRHFSDLPNLAYVMQSWMATTLNQDDVSDKIPDYLKQTLLFPYGYGASFLQEVWKDSPGWDSVNRIYSDLPTSTEQILHPEKYFGVRDDPKPVVAIDPVARLGGDWRITYQNVLGEFSLRLFMNLHFTEEYAAKTVADWGGDTVIYLENGAGQDAVFVNLIWDNKEAAERFFTAMDTWLLEEFPEGKRENETSNGFSLISDEKFYEIQRDEECVHFILGLPENDGRKWLGK